MASGTPLRRIKKHYQDFNNNASANTSSNLHFGDPGRDHNFQSLVECDITSERTIIYVPCLLLPFCTRIAAATGPRNSPFGMTCAEVEFWACLARHS